MNRVILFLLIVTVVLVSGSGCTKAERPSTNVRYLASRNREFAVALYQEIGKGEGNLFFSPYSVSTALAMAYAGARGRTEKEMAEVLRFTGFEGDLHPTFREIETLMMNMNDKGRLEVMVANSLWLDARSALLEGYRDLVSENYRARIGQMDFAGAPESARLEINSWAAEKTKGRIKGLIPKGYITPDMGLVLANAIYFKGDWEKKFNEAHTQVAPFFVSPEDTVWIPMMSLRHEFRYGSNQLAEVLIMPYSKNLVNMIVLLPQEGVSLRELESGLTATNIAQWVMTTEYIPLRVFLPRFNLRYARDLAQTLAGMGMKDAFIVAEADFSGMDGGHPGLFMSAVLHNAFVEVNEKGTEAAAATSVEMTIGISPEPTVFRAERPFVFMIWEPLTSSILFMGRVVNPSKT